MIAFLIAVRVALSRSANTNGVNVSSSGSGPRRLVYASQPRSSSSHTVPRRRTSRYTNSRPSSRVQVRTAYFASSFVSRRSYTTSEPVMRGCTTRRSPLASRNTACLARRPTSSKAFPLRVRSKRGFDTRRSTSVFARRTRAILKPSSRGASSRTIVSTSGSSGTRLPGFPPRNVAPIRLSRKRDQLARIGAAARSLAHRVAQPGDREHPSAVHPEPALRVALGARVEHQRPGLEIARHDDRGTQLGLIGIPGRREHRRHGGAGRREGRLPRPPASGGDLRQVTGNARQHREQRLRFGVAEAAVELED